MQLFLTISQVTLGLLLVGAILLQNKGAGLGSAFGGEGTVYSTRRGPERALFITTIVLAILFVGVAFTTVLLP